MNSENGKLPAHPIVRQEFTRKEGGFITPVVILEQFGLTKREAFAMAAMQGLLANSHFAQQVDADGSMAKAAVYHADDLLAELAKEQA